MRWNILVPLFCFLLIASPGSKKRETPQPVPRASQESNQAQIDVCGLLTKEEIEAIQGSPIKETKSSAHSDAGFLVSQCFYTAAEFARSVSLSVTQRDPSSLDGRDPKTFWGETFGHYGKDKKESETGNSGERARPRSEEGEKESVPPKEFEGIGKEAFWASSRFGGILYVLKGDAFISISLGGSDNEERKLQKSKALAEKALKRL